MTAPRRPTRTRAPQPAKSTTPPPPERGTPRGAAAQAPAAGQGPRRQVITDSRAIRALAHPLRVALLEAIGRDGEITATRAAELLGESPGNMSWHLQTLAKYGFVEETGGGRGRSRPWRVTSDIRTFESGVSDLDAAAAGEALERTVLERTVNQMREWWTRRMSYPAKWRRSAFVTDSVRYLTAAELATVMRDMTAIYDRYADRQDPENRPAGALPVRLHAHGHPLPTTASGN